MQVWALTLIANVYLGIAERALEIAVDQSARRTSIAIPRGTFAHHPFVQHQVADMYLALDAARACVDTVARDWVDGVDHGPMWGPKVLSRLLSSSRCGSTAVIVNPPINLVAPDRHYCTAALAARSLVSNRTGTSIEFAVRAVP